MQRKKNQKLMGIFLVFIMFGSVFGLVVNSFLGQGKKVSIEYNGFEFVNQNSYWEFQKDNLNFVFKNNPNQVEEIPGEIDSYEKYYYKPIYFYSENSESTSEISNNFNQISLGIEFACLEEDSCDESVQIKNCEDNFILIKENSEKNIFQKDNCVFIEGPKEELVKITDEFLFKTLEIRKR